MVTSNKIALFFFVLLGTFLINVELTAVNLALYKIAQDFSVPMGKTSGILSLYLISFAVFTVVGGKLGDLLGRKKIILFMIVIFIVASCVGGMTHIFYMLLAARAFQGLSAGAALPNFTAVLYDSFPHDKKRFVIGAISATVGLSTAIGPLVGSFITHYLGWRYIFYMNLPLGLIVLIGVINTLTHKQEFLSKNKIDLTGLVLTVMTILTLIVGINSLSKAQRVDTGILFIVFIILFFVWLLHHKKCNSAFLNLHLFNQRTYVVGCLIRMLLGFCYYIVLYILGMYAQTALNLDLSLSGFLYLPMTISVTLASLSYGRLSENINFPSLLRLGLLVFLVGMLVFFFFTNNIWIVVLSLIVLGLAYGVLYSSLFSLTLYHINPENTSEASGSLYFFNLLGGAVGVAFTGVLFSLFKNISEQILMYKTLSYMLMVCAIMVAASLLISIFFLKLNHLAKA